jgi:hypothetical protein
VLNDEVIVSTRTPAVPAAKSIVDTAASNFLRRGNTGRAGGQDEG